MARRPRDEPRPAWQRRRSRLGPRGAIALGVLAAALVAWIAVARRDQAVEDVAIAPESVLSSIPPGAMLVAVVDVAGLRSAPHGLELLGQGRSAAGLGEVQTLCGGDPMDAVREIAVAIPDGALDAGFGFFATGDFDPKHLLGCAEKIVTQRGGKPARTPSGRFEVLRDTSLELSSAELAVAQGGPVILAEPSYVRASLGTPASESVAADPRHAALRALVPKGQLVATLVLSAEQRVQLHNELRVHGVSDSPLGALTGAALSLELGARLTFSGALACDDRAACAELAGHVKDAGREQAQSLAARAIGLTPVLEGMVVEATDRSVKLSASMALEDALLLVRRAIALRALVGAQDPIEEPNQEPAPSHSVPSGVPSATGERIPASPSASAPRPVP